MAAWLAEAAAYPAIWDVLKPQAGHRIGQAVAVGSPVLPSDYDQHSLSEAWLEVHGTDEGARLTAELRREVSQAHVLKGTDATAVAFRRFTADSSVDLPPEVVQVASAYSVGKPKLVIYWVPSLDRWAVVHLTWASKTETHPDAPSTELAGDWSAVIEDVRDRDRR